MLTSSQLNMFQCSIVWPIWWNSVMKRLRLYYLSIYAYWGGLCFPSWWDPAVKVTAQYKPLGKQLETKPDKKEKAVLLLSWQCHIPIGRGEHAPDAFILSVFHHGGRSAEKMWHSEGRLYAFMHYTFWCEWMQIPSADRWLKASGSNHILASGKIVSLKRWELEAR